MRIVVLGAGIIGLTSAVAIQRKFPTVEVTILASEFSPDLTSDIAAGLIEPYSCPDESENVIRWFRQTIKYIQNHMKEHPQGTQEMSGFVFYNNLTEQPEWMKYVPFCRQLTDEEIKQRHSQPQKLGFYFMTYYLEPSTHIDFLTKEFQANGGNLIRKHLESLDDVGDKYDVIINCTGLGSKKLFNDTNIRPVRGQVMRVRAPQVKHFFIDDNFYCLLNDEIVILGGTADENEWDITVNPQVAKRILAGNIRNIPALKNGKILSHHVGLRPVRDTIRLELSSTKIANRTQVPVIHNYGHGGSGVTLCWGCAEDVVELLKPLINHSKY